MIIRQFTLTDEAWENAKQLAANELLLNGEFSAESGADAYVATLTPGNVLRLAFGDAIVSRGGPRPAVRQDDRRRMTGARGQRVPDANDGHPGEQSE